MKDLVSSIAEVLDVTALSRSANAAVNGAGADLQGFNGAVVVFFTGAWTDGSIACKIQEADDAAFTVNNGDVAAADVVGGANLQTIAAANTFKELGYIGKRRFIRGVMTQSGATTGSNQGSLVIKGFAIKQPA